MLILREKEFAEKRKLKDIKSNRGLGRATILTPGVGNIAGSVSKKVADKSDEKGDSDKVIKAKATGTGLGIGAGLGAAAGTATAYGVGKLLGKNSEKLEQKAVDKAKKVASRENVGKVAKFLTKKIGIGAEGTGKAIELVGEYAPKEKVTLAGKALKHVGRIARHVPGLGSWGAKKYYENGGKTKIEEKIEDVAKNYIRKPLDKLKDPKTLKKVGIGGLITGATVGGLVSASAAHKNAKTRVTKRALLEHEDRRKEEKEKENKKA